MGYTYRPEQPPRQALHWPDMERDPGGTYSTHPSIHPSTVHTRKVLTRDRLLGRPTPSAEDRRQAPTGDARGRAPSPAQRTRVFLGEQLSPSPCSTGPLHRAAAVSRGCRPATLHPRHPRHPPNCSWSRSPRRRFHSRSRSRHRGSTRSRPRPRTKRGRRGGPKSRAHAVSCPETSSRRPPSVG